MVSGALGAVNYEVKSSERGNLQFRRSLYFVTNKQKGDVIEAGDIRSVRPGFGAAPKFLPFFIGRRLVRDVQKNTPALMDDVI